MIIYWFEIQVCVKIQLVLRELGREEINAIESTSSLNCTDWISNNPLDGSNLIWCSN